MRTVHHAIAALFVTGLAVSIAACSSGPNSDKAQAAHVASLTPIPPPSLTDTTAHDYPGVHNAVAYHQNFISGSVPEGDQGFDTLAAMGVKTIISVDGAVPEVDKAEARGMRYIHLPIGYSGFDETRKLQLTRATRDAMAQGGVYIHCHHGKHRSAGAAATVTSTLGWTTPEQGVARMKVSGTSPNYTGLYACAADAKVLTVSAIDAVSADLPAISRPNSFVKAMIEVDAAFENLKYIEKAGWKTPADHPDLVPAAEAGRLADMLRVSCETDLAKSKPTDFVAAIAENSKRASVLEEMIVANEPDVAKLSAQYKLVGASCKDCHVKYRDKP